LLGFGLYNAALAYGRTTVSAGTAGLLHASVPVFTALLAVAFLGERLGGLAWAGIAVSFSGAALISLGEGGGLRFDAGALLVLLSAISASLYFVVQKPYLERYGALEFTAYSIWMGTLFLSPFLPELVGEARGPDGGNVERGLRGGLRHRGRLRDPCLRLLAVAGLQGGGGELPDPPAGSGYRLDLAGGDTHRRRCGGRRHHAPGRSASEHAERVASLRQPLSLPA
jgi:hypothetical protein